MVELAKKVEDNAKVITDVKAAANGNTERIDGHDNEIQKLTDRVRVLEGRGPKRPETPRRAVLSEAYMRARRSIRVWPVAGVIEEELWGNAGEFLHWPLAIPESEVGQDDVEAVFPVNDPIRPESIRDEVVIRFKNSRIRDMVMFNSVNLATCVDPDGRPTAGTRLELPDELKDTFRHLSRFGTRLRARHGAGTKRHIKFDDFTGSLYANVKLPGDTGWTRVTPGMAASDLEASMREENEMNQKRLAAKLVPGPRERLQRTLTESRSLAPRATRAAAPSTAEGIPDPSGKRPRWSGPPQAANIGMESEQRYHPSNRRHI